MTGFAADWLATLRSLGESFLAVLRAEVAAFKEDVRTSGRLAIKGTVLTGLAAFSLFWLIGTLIFVLIALLAQTLDAWLAALVVSGVLLLIILVLGLWARAVFRKVSGPKATAQRHVQEHVDWIRGELGIAPSALDEGVEDENG